MKGFCRQGTNQTQVELMLLINGGKRTKTGSKVETHEGGPGLQNKTGTN